MPERMKMIVEGAGNCLMDVSEAHKIWLKKLPRVNGRLDPFSWIQSKNLQNFKKNYWVVTVFDKTICYNGLENMKSAIRNLKSEMGGAYLTKPSVTIRAY